MRSIVTRKISQWPVSFLVISVLLGVAPRAALGVSLGDPFTVGEGKQGLLETYYVCQEGLQFVKAGWGTAAPKQRLFAITFKGYCGILPAGKAQVPVDSWIPVMLHGAYDYDAGWATELIEAQQGKALYAVLQCSNNPWVTGQTCPVKSLENLTGSAANYGYPISALLLTAALRADLKKWEAAQGSVDPLASWNPGIKKYPSPIAIVTPDLGTQIPAGAAAFPLQLSATSPQPSWIVDLEWARLTAGKDPSIEPLAYQYGTPAGAPKSVIWSQLPTQLTIPGVFAPGLYAVRAKLRSPPSPETDWELFWIGEPDPNLAKYVPGTPYVGMRKVTKLSKVLLIGKGQVKRVIVSDLAKLTMGTPAKPGQAVAAAGRGEVGAQLDSLGKRLATLERQGGKDCVDCPRLRQDLDTLRLQLQSGRTPATSTHEVKRLGQDLQRLEARLGTSAPGSGQPSALPRSSPSATASGAGTTPPIPEASGPRAATRTPGTKLPPIPPPDAEAARLATDLDAFERRLAALGDQGQGLRPKLQELRRDLAARLNPLEARRRLDALVKEADSLDRRLQQVPRGSLAPLPLPR